MELNTNTFFNLITNTIKNVSRVEEKEIKLKDIENNQEYSFIKVLIEIESSKQLQLYISYERKQKNPRWLTLKGGYTSINATEENPLWCITSYSADIVITLDTMLHRFIYGVELNEKELDEVIL